MSAELDLGNETMNDGARVISSQMEGSGDPEIKGQSSPAAALCVAVAQEMRVTRRLVEELAAVLTADARFVTEYLHQLQAFDLIVQHVDESAALLDRIAGGQRIGAAVDGIRLAAMQQRLRAALG